MSSNLTAGGFSTVTINGGRMWSFLIANDSSMVTMNGGTLSQDLYTNMSSTVTINGGTVEGGMFTYGSSAVTMNGGVVVEGMYAKNSSTITIAGRDFEVNGVPAPYGNLTAETGTLTGRLASGDPINNAFLQGGGSWTGTITLVPPDYLPTLSPWSQLALMLGLLGAGLGVWRGRATPRSSPA